MVAERGDLSQEGRRDRLRLGQAVLEGRPLGVDERVHRLETGVEPGGDEILALADEQAEPLTLAPRGKPADELERGFASGRDHLISPDHSSHCAVEAHARHQPRPRLAGTTRLELEAALEPRLLLRPAARRDPRHGRVGRVERSGAAPRSAPPRDRSWTRVWNTTVSASGLAIGQQRAAAPRRSRRRRARADRRPRSRAPVGGGSSRSSGRPRRSTRAAARPRRRRRRSGAVDAARRRTIAGARSEQRARHRPPLLARERQLAASAPRPGPRSRSGSGPRRG